MKDEDNMPASVVLMPDQRIWSRGSGKDPEIEAWFDRARVHPVERLYTNSGLKFTGGTRNEPKGPCPGCGGHDRFGLNIKKQTFVCHACSLKGAGAIDYLVQTAAAKTAWEAADLLEGPAPSKHGKANGKSNGHAEALPDWKHPEGEFPYHGEKGEVLYKSVRYPLIHADGSRALSGKGKPDKAFVQYHPNGNGWVKGRGDASAVPYHLDAVVKEMLDANARAETPRFLIFEGEAKANFIHGKQRWPGTEHKLVATSIPKGAKDFGRYFAGGLVWIVPDNDAAGRAYRDQVAAALHPHAESIRVVELPGLGEGEDIVDWGPRHKATDFFAAVDASTEWKPRDDGAGVAQRPDGLHEVPRSLLDPSLQQRADQEFLESADASTYTMRAVRWFWPNRFALRKIGLLGGLPDRGKGLIISDVISRATRGGTWPCNEGCAVQGDVLLLTAEDDIEDTIIPRLVGAGADLSRVRIIKMVKQQDGKRMFNLVSDLELLREKIKAIGNAVLIVIDPMSAYVGVGKIDSYRATDVRGILGPLKELAEETMVSILGIMHFNKKADVHNAMLRIADSLAYVAAARHCYVVVDDAENQRRLFVKAKNNLAPDMAALSYTVDTKNVGTDPITNAAIIAPYVVWGSEHVYVSATEAMQAEEKSSGAAKPRDTAKEFLTNLLALGPMKQKEVMDAAAANLISEKTLRRAKDDLGIIPKKDGARGPWLWELPAKPSGHLGNRQK